MGGGGVGGVYKTFSRLVVGWWVRGGGSLCSIGLLRNFFVRLFAAFWGGHFIGIIYVSVFVCPSKLK